MGLLIAFLRIKRYTKAYPIATRIKNIKTTMTIYAAVDPPELNGFIPLTGSPDSL